MCDSAIKWHLQDFKLRTSNARKI